MTIPARPQTFGLENCRDVIEKLRWEIEQLQTACAQDPASQMHICYNAAVTVWQVADWVYLDMTAAQREKLQIAKLGDLQMIVRRECRALHLCRQIATASKHGIVERHRDESVDAATSATSFPTEADENFVYETPTVWVMKIVDGAERLPALAVFESALQYWNQFVHSHRIG